jgi:membrane-associated PAP2 superfamily phosphatase
MKYTNTKRALMGAIAIAALLGILLYRRAGAAFTQSDYLIVGAALLLVAMNLAGSYYYDRKAYQENSRGK